MTDIDAVCEAVVKERNEEIERLTNLVRQTHREYVLVKASLADAIRERDEAYEARIDDNRRHAETRERMRAVVDSAKAWREAYNLPFDPGGCYEVRAASRVLIAAIDAARGKL